MSAGTHGERPVQRGQFSVQQERKPYRVGYAPGAYDLFHIGHLNILRHARQHCDYLVAGVVSDEMAELAKGRRPVIPLIERLEIVRNIKYVDAAFVETVPDKLDTWQQVRFDVLFKGDDWRGTPKGDKLERDFTTVGVEIVYFPYTVHTSSTQLRRALDTLTQPPDPAAAGQSAEHS
ncbi:adenylyltransferase/cytidyltransferase family protein [Streptomyces sp. MUM 178J]|uniref:adenylyltransferase/cytidyltransferase family protein n=1 Tax=Streptomyces sp. MUM 178J TaxID=2791991 RepID=UPI003FA75C6B